MALAGRIVIYLLTSPVDDVKDTIMKMTLDEALKCYPKTQKEAFEVLGVLECHVEPMVEGRARWVGNLFPPEAKKKKEKPTQGKLFENERSRRP